jgi:hypothetical protein
MRDEYTQKIGIDRKTKRENVTKRNVIDGQIDAAKE